MLEEDGDSGHGWAKKTKIVQEWKRENELASYKNVAGSPDLSLIENCWLPLKEHYKAFPRWDDFTSRELIQEG